MKISFKNFKEIDKPLIEKERAIRKQWRKEAIERNRQLREQQEREQRAHEVYVACLARELEDIRREMREQGYS